MTLHESTSKTTIPNDPPQIIKNQPLELVMLNHLRNHLESSPLSGNISSALGKSLSGSMASWAVEVSKNGGTPKWMVCNRKQHLEMDDLGVPLFQETTIFLYMCKNKFIFIIERYTQHKQCSANFGIILLWWSVLDCNMVKFSIACTILSPYSWLLWEETAQGISTYSPEQLGSH